MRILTGVAFALSVLFAAPPLAARTAGDLCPARHSPALPARTAPTTGADVPKVQVPRGESELTRLPKGPRSPWRRHGWHALGGKTRTLLTEVDFGATRVAQSAS